MDIYEEKRPSRIDKNSEQKDYPKELILNITDIERPTVGAMASSIRNYIIECNESKISGVVVFNFCIDMLNVNINNHILNLTEQKFITLAEYISNMKNEFSEMNFVMTVRGFFLASMAPLLFIDMPYKVSKFTRFVAYENVASGPASEAMEYWFKANNLDVPNNKQIESLIRS